MSDLNLADMEPCGMLSAMHWPKAKKLAFVQRLAEYDSAQEIAKGERWEKIVCRELGLHPTGTNFPIMVDIWYDAVEMLGENEDFMVAIGGGLGNGILGIEATERMRAFYCLYASLLAELWGLENFPSQELTAESL